MLKGYDQWKTTDTHAEEGDRVVGYDFEGNPVTENELHNYYLVEGELVLKDDKQSLEDFLQLDELDLQEVLKYFYSVNDRPTIHDL